MSSPPSTPAPAADPEAAQNLDAAASNADAGEGSDNVGNPVASCPPAAKPSQGPPASGAKAGPGPKTFIEVLVTDENDKPVTNQKYRIHLTDGSKQEGKLDSSGRIYFSSIPAGTCDLMFLEMLDFGVPDEEVKRSWDWKRSQGDGPKQTNLHFEDNEALTTDDSTGDANAPAEADSPPPDDSAEEED